MKATHFFWMLESGRVVHARRMSEKLDVAIVPSQRLEWFEHLKARYRVDEPKGTLPEGFEEEFKAETLSGAQGQAAMASLFRGAG